MIKLVTKRKRTKGNSLVRLSSIRWFLLSIFIIGYLITYPYIVGYEYEYLILSLISTGMCALLLARFYKLSISSLPIWIILFAFVIGYYIKFYWLLLGSTYLDSVMLPFTKNRLTLVSDSTIAITSFRLTTIGFIVFCAFFAFFGKHSIVYPSLILLKRNYTSIFVVLSEIIGLFLLGLTTLLSVRTGALNAAVFGKRMPFRLAGWLYYIRSVMLPIIFLFIIYCGLSVRSKKWIVIGILLLLLLALSDLLIRTTRSSLIYMAISLGFIFYLSGRQVTKRQFTLIITLIVISFFLFPIITQYRYLRAYNTSASISLFLESSGQYIRYFGLGSSLLNGVLNIVSRFIGIDSLLFLTDQTSWPGFAKLAAIFHNYGSIGAYFTRHVIGFKGDFPHGEAPSLLGWFLIMGGIWGLTLGFGLYLFVGWWIWQWISQSRMLILPIVQVEFLLLWLSYSSEGTLDGSIIRLFATIICLLLLEYLLRWNIKYCRTTRL